MVKACIEYKDGTVENRTFKGVIEYFRYVDKNKSKIKISTSDVRRPNDRMGARNGVHS